MADSSNVPPPEPPAAMPPCPGGLPLPPPPAAAVAQGDSGSDAPPARPAFLLGGLSSLKSSQVVRLPSRDELVEFTAVRPKRKPQSWAATPTQRIREIDGCRLHTPSPQEKDRVSIPSAVDRINVTCLNHLLILCGGYRSVRFSSEELAALTALSHALEEKFNAVEQHYKSMTGAQKKHKIELLPTAASSEDAAPSVDDPAAVAVAEPDDSVTRFHVLADQYVDAWTELQDLARRKQTEIVPQSTVSHAEEGVDHTAEAHDVTPGADIDLLAGLARPVWLDVLMVKYSRHMNRRSENPSSAPIIGGGSNYPHCNPLNLGSFCSFLSCCLVGKISIFVEEHQALIELLTASNDNVLSINPISDSVEDITRKIMDQDQAYWAKRVFAFLKKLPDLKTAVKDNRLLLDFERHYK